MREATKEKTGTGTYKSPGSFGRLDRNPKSRSNPLNLKGKKQSQGFVIGVPGETKRTGNNVCNVTHDINLLPRRARKRDTALFELLFDVGPEKEGDIDIKAGTLKGKSVSAEGAGLEEKRGSHLGL